jgi:hypothetical protein
MAYGTIELILHPLLKLKIGMGSFGIISKFSVEENKPPFIVGRFGRKNK